MSAFSNAVLDQVVLDPYKRVSYVNGLVLGVDEFRQEQLYFIEKDRLHGRGLHGYGTFLGLRVEIAEDDPQAGTQIVVQPGLALSPRGEVIRVPCPQCASISRWLQQNGQTVSEQVGSPPGEDLTLYVVLRYRECETDRVPIPSGPCRSLDETSAPSRIADAFELELRTEPPAQEEEEAVRRFGAFLRSLEVTDDPVIALPIEEVEGRLRDLFGIGSSPPLEGLPTSPPEPLAVLRSEVDVVCRRLFLVWVTEVRPRFTPREPCECITEPRESCVLLARVQMPVVQSEGIWQLAGTPVIDESERPYLLHTRLLQEWLCHCSPTPAEEGVPMSPSAGPIITVHADLDGLEADDHPQYLLADGTRPLQGDWDVTGGTSPGFRITNMLEGAQPGDAVNVGQAVLDGDPARGDLSGAYPNPQVGGLVDAPLEVADPRVDGRVLRWRPGPTAKGKWVAEDLPSPSSPREESRLIRVQALSWYHRGTTDFQIRVNGQPRVGLAIGLGHEGVAHGAPPTGDRGRVLVEEGSLWEDTFQVFLEIDGREPQTGTPGRILLRLEGEVIPVAPRNAVGSTFLGADFVRVSGPEAPAAAFVAKAVGTLQDLTPIPFLVVLKSDFVLDPKGRAIDGEHLRGALPSGDRPSSVPVGVQGGELQSWGTFSRGNGGAKPPKEPTPFSVDLNRDPVEVLVTIDGINNTLARRIVDARAAGPIRSSADLVNRVIGIGTESFNRDLRRFVRPLPEGD